MHQISDTVDRKFVDSIEVDDWQIETEGGWVDITHINITVEYDVYQLTTTNCHVECADDHIVFRETGEEVFVKDLSPGDAIKGQNGIEYVISVVKTDRKEHMADLTVRGNHTFYAHGLLHHNTTTVAAYLAWYLIFNDAKTVAILANKAAAAREIMSRLQLMIENLPKWLQQGVVEWNKGSVAFENDSKAFTAATSSSGIRGKSCVTADTKVCLEDNGNIYYCDIGRTINNSIFIDVENEMKKYAIYKTTNTVNGNIYIGFHTTTENGILRREYGPLSCFDDGYLGSGKLLKYAIEKYGPENFAQEIIDVFDNKKEAENLERQLVNKDFVQEDNNYNISIGGNVTILYGQDNGFYGKNHTKETIDKIQASRKESGLPTYQCIGTDVKTGQQFKGYKEILEHFGFDFSDTTNDANKKRIFLGGLVNDGLVEFSNKDFQEKVLARFKYFERTHSKQYLEDMRAKRAKIASERFKGKKFSEEHKQKISESLNDWLSVEENRQSHRQRVIKTNKNPEKIRKTAEKHCGMKRSEETKKRMSESRKGKPSSTKGRKFIENIETKERKHIPKEDPIPDGWQQAKGTGGVKSGTKVYTNGVEYKYFVPGGEPSGWILGGPPKKRKSKQ